MGEINRISCASILAIALIQLQLCDVIVDATAHIVDLQYRGSTYREIQLDKWCGATKREILLGTRSAVLYFDESKSDYLSKHDLNCHLELETLKGGLSGIRRSSKYGFLVYIDEMELDGDSKHTMTSTNDKCPDDYVQFGRDALFVTTNLSQKFCGSFERVHFHNTSAVDRWKVLGMPGNIRSHVEKKDHEMDLWVNLKKNRDPNRGHPNEKPFRKIRIIVTIFKKDCKKDLSSPHTARNWIQINNHYTQLANAQYQCIQKTYACDTIPNSVWPNGKDSIDESECNGKYKHSPLSLAAGGIPSPAKHKISVPLIVIKVVLLTLGLTGIALIARMVIHKVKKRLGADKPLTTVIEMRNEGARLEQDSNVHAHQDGQLAPPYSVSLVHSDSNQDQMYNHSTSFGEAEMRDPMSPPSYDEATKNMPQSAASPLYLGDPPPYQPVRRLSS